MTSPIQPDPHPHDPHPYDPGLYAPSNWPQYPRVHDHHRTVRFLYLYAVCLVAIVVTIYAAVQLTTNAVQFIWPDPGFYNAEDLGIPKGQYIAALRHENVVSGLGAAAALLISVPLFIYHWIKAQQAWKAAL